ncbi:MAG TPA: hypothetical protein PK530_04775 [Anaerolineales bacterium]|nr:hypothetical protein [Anaerolineales bacterium]
MYYRSLKLIPLLLVFLLFATACGDSSRITVDDLPQFSLNEKLPGESPLADGMVAALQETVRQQGLTAEAKIYAVPTDTTFDVVKSFYTRELGSVWLEDPQLANDQEGFQTSGWRLGGPSGEESVVVTLVSDPLAGEKILIVVLFLGQ